MEWREDKIGLGYGYNSKSSHPILNLLWMKKAGGLEEFMDAEERSDSECSSGCQSGWTLYLGQSQESFTVSVRVRTGEEEEEEEEEEDLSMLSDASSGPPVVHEDNNIRYCCCCFCCCYNDKDGCFANYGGKRRRSEEEKEKKMSFSLEDTASSPFFSCYKATNTRCSNKKKSESRFKGKNELQKQLGYLHSFCTCESSTGLQR